MRSETRRRPGSWGWRTSRRVLERPPFASIDARSRPGLVVWLLVLAIGSFAPPAFGATGVQTSLSEEQAEVGESVQVELSAMSDTDDVPQNPRLELPPGFSVRGPNVSSSQQISIMNGTFQRRRGITATWAI